MTPRALMHILLVACLGVILAQASAACAMPAAGHADHAAMADGPCPPDRDASAMPVNCALICPLSCAVVPSAVDGQRTPYVAKVRFDDVLPVVTGVRLAPDDPPPR
jgi:hypothetical protein